jgi:hypothetical protein
VTEVAGVERRVVGARGQRRVAPCMEASILGKIWRLRRHFRAVSALQNGTSKPQSRERWPKGFAATEKVKKGLLGPQSGDRDSKIANRSRIRSIDVARRRHQNGYGARPWKLRQDDHRDNHQRHAEDHPGDAPNGTPGGQCDDHDDRAEVQ